MKIDVSKKAASLNPKNDAKFQKWFQHHVKKLSSGRVPNVDLLKKFNDKMNDIFYWYHNAEPNIGTFKPEKAIEVASRFVETHSGIVHKFPNGFFIKKLTAEELAGEGEDMGHCVDEYYDKVDMGKTEIYSLRDRGNNPHVTMELNSKGAFCQFSGKENDIPIPEYVKMLLEWKGADGGEIYGLPLKAIPHADKGVECKFFTDGKREISFDDESEEYSVVLNASGNVDINKKNHSHWKYSTISQGTGSVYMDRSYCSPDVSHVLTDKASGISKIKKAFSYSRYLSAEFSRGEIKSFTRSSKNQQFSMYYVKDAFPIPFGKQIFHINNIISSREDKKSNLFFDFSYTDNSPDRMHIVFDDDAHDKYEIKYSVPASKINNRKLFYYNKWDDGTLEINAKVERNVIVSGKVKFSPAYNDYAIAACSIDFYGEVDHNVLPYSNIKKLSKAKINKIIREARAEIVSFNSAFAKIKEKFENDKDIVLKKAKAIIKDAKKVHEEAVQKCFANKVATTA
jgi:hypothetical protein